eukprot:7382756-Heterocapsa_arctica.AAC.1
MPKEKRRRSTRIDLRVAKSQRDAEQERLLEQEEFDARSVGVVNLHGPPRYDEYTGIELPEEEVRVAMGSERASLDDFKMKRDADESELKENIPGTVVVDCRWLLHRKKATKKVKARAIDRQVRHGRDELDTFAATATSVGAR